MPTPPAFTPRLPKRHRLRAAATLALVLALHGLGGWWLMNRPSRIDSFDDSSVPITVSLIKPQPVVMVTPPPAPPARPKPAREVLPVAPRPVTPVPETPPPATAEAPAISAQPAASAVAASPASAASGTAGQAQVGMKFSPPPSADLSYNTYYNGMRNETGTIHWRLDGNRYNLFVSMPVPFVGPYTYESRGHFDAFGIAPDQYLETRGRHPADIAVFDREAHQIVYTRTPNSVPLPDGALDRFSLLIELAGLMRGDANAFRPGVAHTFFITDRDSGEDWPIQVVGDETIDTDDGPMQARHFVRLPRRSGDTRRIDIWLAPSLGWLPARMTQHEPGGALIELVWSGGNAMYRNKITDSTPTPPAALPGAASTAPAATAGDEPIQH